MTKIVVFDAQGPVYLMTTKEGNVISIKDTKQLKIKIYPSFYEDFEDYFSLSTKRMMVVEEELILGKNISVTSNPGIIEFFTKLREEGIKPVIITFGTKKATIREMEIIAEKYNQENNTNITEEDIIPIKDIHSIIDNNLTKANGEDWKKIINDNYENAEVVAVFEDTFNWLKVATKAFDCKGFLVIDEGECVEKEGYYEGNLKKMSEKFFDII